MIRRYTPTTDLVRFTMRRPARVFGVVYAVMLAVILLVSCLVPTHAHAAPRAIPHKHAASSTQPARQSAYPIERDQFETAPLTPEQTALVNWVLDVAQPKLAVAQARQIVRYSYQQIQDMQIEATTFFALMRLESRFNPHALSREGAKGLMQVRDRVHHAKFQGTSPYDVQASIRVGAAIFTDCMDKHHQNLARALNCYSGGGGSAYNKLFVQYKHQADHFVVAELFNQPPEDPLDHFVQTYEVAEK